jgi:hypothetical protein
MQTLNQHCEAYKTNSRSYCLFITLLRRSIYYSRHSLDLHFNATRASIPVVHYADLAHQSQVISASLAALQCVDEPRTKLPRREYFLASIEAHNTRLRI